MNSDSDLASTLKMLGRGFWSLLFVFFHVLALIASRFDRARSELAPPEGRSFFTGPTLPAERIRPFVLVWSKSTRGSFLVSLFCLLFRTQKALTLLLVARIEPARGMRSLNV